MLLMLHLLLLQLFTKYCQTQHLTEINLIQHFLDKQEITTSAIFFTCWDRAQIFSMMKQMNHTKFGLHIVTNFSKILEIDPGSQMLFITHSECKDVEFLLNQAENRIYSYFKLPYKWLIFNHEDRNPIPATLKILIDSQVVLAKKQPNGQYHLQLIFKYTKEDLDFSYTDMAKYSGQGFDYYHPFSLGMNRTNMMRRPLTISYVMSHPEFPLDFTDYRYAHIDSVSKLSYIMVYFVLEMVNCTKNYIQHLTWGYKGENDTYYKNGMMGDLQNGTAEIAGTVGFYTLSRLETVDYIAATTPSNMQFILKAPPLSMVENLFTLPFNEHVWYCLYAITIITIVSLYFIIRWESVYYGKILHKLNNIDNIKPKFMDVVMVQIGGITQQGSDTEPKSNSGRIAFFFILLILMFLYTAYSASIVVLLQSTSNNIRSVRDLLDSSISLGVEETVYSRYYFETQKEPIRKAIYKTKIAPKGEKSHFFSVNDGIKKVKDEFFAFHCETSPCYKEIKETFQEHEKCGLIEINYLNLLYPSLSVRKLSPYREMMKIGVRRLYDVGIRSREINRIYYKRPVCSRNEGSFTSVGLLEIYFSLVLYASGVGLSFTILLLEIFYKKYETKILSIFEGIKKMF